MRWFAFAAVVVVLGCVPLAAPPQVPPPEEAPATTKWNYAATLLSQGEVSGAREYLEALSTGPVPQGADPALLWRDLAEARLFSGDLPGTTLAARRARQELALEPDTAQFNADDRYLFEQTIDALEAAATPDLEQLQTIARDEHIAPTADTWYLLGWLDEQRGDLTSARTAYRAFLDRAPQWAFLRQAFVMRGHAQLVAQ